MKNILLILPFLVIFSCSQSNDTHSSKNPTEVALEYVKFEANFDTEGMKKLLSNEDRDSFIPNDLSSMSELIDLEVLADARKMLALQVKYEVLSSEKSEKTAQVKINMISPNLMAAMGEIMAASFKDVFSESENDKTEDVENSLELKIEELAQSKDLPTLEVEKIINLIFEDGEWRVFKNFKLEKILADAKKLENQKEFAKAMTLVSSAMEIDPYNKEANNLASTLQDKIGIEKIKADYFSKIEIFEFESKYFESILYGKVPGIKFALKNNGDKTLNKVQVKVYFLDNDGLAIAEDTYTPVNNGTWCFSDCDPLKPNYIWRHGDQFYKKDTLGPEWSGKATIEIADIEFE